MNNMKFSWTAKPENIKEEINFKVVKCDDNIIELLSNEGIYNFNQYGISFKLEKAGDLKTNVNIKIHYSISGLASWAQTGVSMANRLLTFSSSAKKLPEMDEVLFIRMRSMLDFTVRHMCRYVTEHLPQVEIKPMVNSTLTLGQANSPRFTYN